ncbi:MAG: helix-turn-helix domain-containing protein [Gemmataceae bacterium]
MHPLQKKFGAVLRRRREEAGLSQEELAEKAGLHRNYVGLLERGQRMPTILAVQQLAEALGTTLTGFLAEVESEKSGRGKTGRRRE